MLLFAYYLNTMRWQHVLAGKRNVLQAQTFSPYLYRIFIYFYSHDNQHVPRRSLTIALYAPQKAPLRSFHLQKSSISWIKKSKVCKATGKCLCFPDTCEFSPPRAYLPHLWRQFAVGIEILAKTTLATIGLRKKLLSHLF